MSAGKKGGAVRVKYSHQSTLSHLIFPPPCLQLLQSFWRQLSGHKRDFQLILIKRITDLNTCFEKGERRARGKEVRKGR